MSKPFKVIATAIISLLLVMVLFAERAPPRSLTAGRMHVSRWRILQFAYRHNKLPATLAELPARPGYDNATDDAWGRPLDYSVDDSGAVMLRSLGADRRSGGEGDDRDMTAVFPSRDAQNHWQQERAEWKQDPLRP